MHRKKAVLIMAAVLFFGSMGLWAGDTAIFADLGFSADGNTYAFAQYGVQSSSLRPWADMFIVDVPTNNFVPGGRINYSHPVPITAGQNGSSALYSIITENASLMYTFRVNFHLQGKPLFVALDDRHPGETISFMDFDNNISYRATLVSSAQGVGTGLRTSFFINLEKTAADGTVRNYEVGTPELWRPQIESYRIRRIIVNPQGTSMIMVIEMTQRDGDWVNIRYMVEAVRL